MDCNLIMSLCKRIIPKLDIKGSNLVKGINLEGLRVMGNPEKFAEYYFNNGADELIYQDVVASLFGKNSLKEIIKKTAKSIFVPLTVGGGIRSIDDIKEVLESGADKVSLNTAVLKKPELISDSANIFGSSTIVVGMEINHIDNDYFCFTDNGRNNSNIKVLDWITQVQEGGAGEIILTFVNRDGTFKGPDLEFLKKLKKIIKIPTIIHGGFGSLEHFRDVFNHSFVSGVCVASLFHNHIIKNNKINFMPNDMGNLQYIQKKEGINNLNSLEITDIKGYLTKNNIKCRP